MNKIKIEKNRVEDFFKNYFSLLNRFYHYEHGIVAED